MIGETLDGSVVRSPQATGPPRPGVVAVFTGGRACLVAFEIGAPVVFGRGDGPTGFDDARMSRSHVEIARDGDWLRARDLDSRNGTQLDGKPWRAGTLPATARVLRTGDTLLLPCRDIRPFLGAVVQLDDDGVAGPTLQAAYGELASIAETSQVAFILGETGSGKELAARAFHRASKVRGAFVAVNCATIPQQLAERLLFGAVKGAFSSADAHAEGYLQAAHDGTLFLDEVIELPLEVQAKLLRVIETREVMPVGATAGRAVRLHLCSAATSDLRKVVTAGKFREDLYYRIGRPAVTIPALRDRVEDLPWLVQRVVAARTPDLGVHVSVVEEALLRPWPGNVRELIAELGEAARRAARTGDGLVRAANLDPDAGMPLHDPDTLAVASLEVSAVETALRETRGNVSEAARRLAVHRTQLRRWIAQHDLDPAKFRDDGS